MTALTPDAEHAQTSGSWRGDCDCGWRGPDRKTRRQASDDWDTHNTVMHAGHYERQEER